jgi:hypothetical protein
MARRISAVAAAAITEVWSDQKGKRTYLKSTLFSIVKGKRDQKPRWWSDDT